MYLRDQSDVSWIRNTYIGFEASPVSVMYGNVDTKVLQSQDIVNAINDAHAGYLYVDELEGEGSALFAPLLGNEKLEYGCLYQVVESTNGMRLQKVQKG